MRIIRDYFPHIFVLILLILLKIFYKIQAQATFLSILPPLIAIILAVFTKKLISSLLVSIISGGILVSDLNGFAFNTVHFITESVFDLTNIEILAFVVFIMAMISVITAGGGFKALVSYLIKFAKTRRSAQFITALLGLIVFIDDYANTMVVGTSARPITDRFKVSREKLAFLVDATSAPVAGLAIISTWIGYEVGLFAEFAKSVSILKDGYSIFFDVFKFRFYCILMIIFVLILALKGKDFGPMRRAEERAENEGKLLNDGAVPLSSKGFERIKEDERAKPSILTFLIPVFILFFFLLSGLWIDGNGLKFLKENPFNLFNPSVWLKVISKSENNILILAISSFLGLLSALIVSKIKSGLDLKNILKYSGKGALSSYLPIMILILAWSLKNVCYELKTAEYLINISRNLLPPKIFPALTFIIASITSFATGTSWGTMAILIPIAGPIAFALDGNTYGLITMITLGSVLDGAIFGDHCSPISDTTIMSSISSSCDHIDHVRTQLPYSVFVASIALTFGYLPVALGISPFISILSAFVFFIVFFNLI